MNLNHQLEVDLGERSYPIYIGSDLLGEASLIAPHIAGENRIYLETQLKAFRSGKREHEIMSVIAKNLSDEDISDLSAWYASVKITATMPE